jgi:gluconate 5-dehydrogenase
VKTKLTSALHNDQQFNEWLLGRTPIGRWAEPEDMSGAVVYLASAESGFMTGQVLVIDGGLTTSLL